ncbi:MAG: alpha/beta hydrolase [Tannerella sp.]|jgi:acetyl esterase/lipase|nr:alpha/beta hydrolase [Tannerella sp.]
MKIRFLILLVWFVWPLSGQTVKVVPEDAIDKQTFTYARKDTCELRLDKYRLKDAPEAQACVMFVFGGGFTNGHRDAERYRNYFHYLAKNGYTVVSIDYRLGLAGGKQHIGPTNHKPLLHAIQMAVSDLYDATAFTLQHAEAWRIDPSRIVISGSSAGAITALQAEYENCNPSERTQALPAGFRYAGVIAFSGAIFNTDGSLKWRAQPCPILLFHGDKDRIVPYKGIRLFKLNFAGSGKIAGSLKKNHFPYWFTSYKGAAHEIAEEKMDDGQEAVLEFIRYFVTGRERKQIDSYVYEPDKLKTGKAQSYKDLY